MLQSSAYAINEHKTDAQKQKNEQLEAEMHFFRQGFLFREMSTFWSTAKGGGERGEKNGWETSSAGNTPVHLSCPVVATESDLS